MALPITRLNASVLRTFGEQALVGATPFTVIYRYEYVEVGDQAGYEPTAVCTASDVTALGIVEGTAINVRGANHIVRIIQPSSSGLSVLVLELQ